jgi:hypothetical protein
MKEFKKASRLDDEPTTTTTTKTETKEETKE